MCASKAFVCELFSPWVNYSCIFPRFPIHNRCILKRVDLQYKLPHELEALSYTLRVSIFQFHLLESPYFKISVIKLKTLFPWNTNLSGLTVIAWHYLIVTDVLVQVSVAVRHGKSRLLAVWSLDELQCSNDNLATLDPARARDGRSYVLPEGGVKAGLASQFILLHRLDTSINSWPVGLRRHWRGFCSVTWS